MAKNLVIVESPAKAKTINKYLGNDYIVIASFGHIRDLPSKDGSVDPDNDFAMSWETSPRSQKYLSEITKQVKNVDHLILATDPDREGEAIAWHVVDVLKNKNLLKNVDYQRVTFNEITKKAVLEAFKHARALDQELIDAYLARRALDYLVGFTISPVLWRKLPGSRSAGRVQSVALRLICDREAEIETFNSQEYWTIHLDLKTPRDQKLTANLTHVENKKLTKFDIPSEQNATSIVNAIKPTNFKVHNIEKKKVNRQPAAPFTTSTLQQEASRKLGFSASKTMTLAQKLYEGMPIKGETVGLITYMRTDGVTISNDAIMGMRDIIKNEYGADYVPSSPRMYKSKAKNAQEAHEAIRPTDLTRKPASLSKLLDADELKLYDLIWKRTMASQMANVILDQTSIDFINQRKDMCRSTGSIIAFPGFYKLYHEDKDDASKADNEDGKILPPVHENEDMGTDKINPEQHFTQPPPRYTEASLVKKLEELGIGRPSTYASIMQVLKDRDYVVLEKKRFTPEGRGRLVTSFLSHFFTRYVEYDFTANLEEQLDEISAGKIKWTDVLSAFWKEFSATADKTKELRITEVLDHINEDLDLLFFPVKEEGKDPRQCPKCGTGKLFIKLGKFGAFAGCTNYPDCNFTKQLTGDAAGGEGEGDDTGDFPKELGLDPETKLPVTLRKGPYGLYIQLGEETTEEVPKARGKGTKIKKIKPKRAPVPRGQQAADITFEIALKLLTLPREIGLNPETKLMITASIGRFGPYLKHNDKFTSLPKDDNVLEIGLNRAVVVLAEKEKPDAPKVIVGEHPKDKKEIIASVGRYGPFVKMGKTIASVGKGKTIEEITLDEAVAAIDAKKGKKAPAKKAATKKAPAKKAAVKKTPAKKAPARKKKA